MSTRARPAAVALTLVASLVTACTTSGPPPSPSPSPTPTPTAIALPRFELATYQYAIQTRGTLRVGIYADDPTFGLRDPAGTFTGFDADMAREVAKAIFGQAARADPDAFITWVPVVSATRISTLTEGKADVVVATFEVDPERAKQIDLSDPYFRTGERLLVKKDSKIASVDDLGDATVCTVRGSPSERAVPARAKQAKILSLDSFTACLQALEQGAADVVWADETTLFDLVRKDSATKIVGAYLSSASFGIGAKKGHVGFMPFLDGVISEAVSSGRWAALYKKWITPVSGDVKDRPDDPGHPAA